MLLPPSDRYRPEIDGLRAVAVLSVVLFYAFPEAVHGGLMGVDIFFVISGFLITAIVARELGSKRFSLATFYARRVRRIFPALILVLCAMLLLGWLAFRVAGALRAMFSQALAFSANIALWLQSGYFDVEAAKNPLVHLWSLGIEEQFYLVWPLMLMLASRLRLSLIWVACAIALASFALNVALIGSNPVGTFYLPITRAFELVVGAALACGWSRIAHSEVANPQARAGVQANGVMARRRMHAGSQPSERFRRRLRRSRPAPLVMLWGDSTASALMPGLRRAARVRQFGIAQFTLSACVPLLSVDGAGNPNCRAMIDKVVGIARKIGPDIVLLLSTWDRYLDHVGDAVAALTEIGARVVVLGAVPWWKRRPAPTRRCAISCCIIG